MTIDPCEIPDQLPHIELPEVDCLENPPEGFQPFVPACLADPDVDPQKLLAGGRAAVVVPYDQDVCSGGKGRFQIISGMGGQICDAIYLGNTCGRRVDAEGKLPLHKVGLQKDAETDYDPDVIHRDPDIPGGPRGERGMAVRDRGQWYVVKMGEGGAPPATPAPFIPATLSTNLLRQPNHFYSPVIPDPWTTEDLNWTDFDLPVTYLHGQPLPNASFLPTTVGWARLRLPSDPLFGASGEAGNPNASYGSTETVTPEETVELVEAVITVGSSRLRLWFSHRIVREFSSPSPDTWADYITLTIENTLTDLPVSSVSLVSGHTNALDVTITAQPDEVWEEAISNGVLVSLFTYPVDDKEYQGLVKSYGTLVDPPPYVAVSDFACIFDDPRSAYVLVMNRVFDYQLNLGTAIDICKKSFILLPDNEDPPNVRRVFDISPGTPPSQLLVRIGGGQGTDNLVLARPTNKPTALAVYDPSATPPAGLPWPNGIGWGDMLLPNGSTQRVLLALWSTAPSTISTAIFSGTVVAVQEQVSITGAGLDPQLMWVPRHV